MAEYHLHLRYHLQRYLEYMLRYLSIYSGFRMYDYLAHTSLLLAIFYKTKL